MMIRKRIILTGQLQGVGCRPYIYNQAKKLGLTGFVRNDTEGVTVEVQGENRQVSRFLQILCNSDGHPAMMKIVRLREREIDIVSLESDFSIIASKDAVSGEIAQVTSDTATCKDCLSELNDQSDRRYRYPFINCVNCGPRYSIVKSIPYDRPNTTMSGFEMCDFCRKQYTDPADRRYHAQPIACPVCGPKVFLTDNSGGIIEERPDNVIAKAADFIRSGGIAAIKGIGGFHLAVDAFNNSAVEELRRRKQRDRKPFALMTQDVGEIEKYCYISEAERNLLISAQSPIVLLDIKQGNESKIGESVAPQMNKLGFMLCYAPLHHLLFQEEGIDVLVMTSANISDQPLICSNEIALAELSGIADVFLMHNRDIYRQVDDSVVHVIDNRPSILRRSRGYVPGPVRNFRSKKQIFAAGADLKNTFCLVRSDQYIVSEHIGDLENSTVYRHYKKSISHFQNLFKVHPRVAACDLHPSYLSCEYARSLDVERIISIQHHWAHIASVLAENNYSEDVIGIVADGTGYGSDGAIWGCECLIASLDRFKRFGHLQYFPLAGGDLSSRQAIRPLMGILKTISDGGRYIEQYSSILGRIEPDTRKLEIISDQIDKDINTVQSSSLGRLFDAVSALAGLGTENRYEANLPMALESAASPYVQLSYPIKVEIDYKGQCVLQYSQLIEQVINDVEKGYDPSVISAKFHNAVAEGLFKFALEARNETSLNVAALSGGVFCNRYLANRLIDMLKYAGFSVLLNKQVPSNDGGISLGQGAIAARAVSI